jgi:isopenicillin N synthase-like dioxygenase
VSAATTSSELNTRLENASRTAFERIPIVDVGALRAPDASARRAVAMEIARACEQVGFFYVANHGIAASAIDALVAKSRELFALPHEIKLRYYIGLSRNHRGYVPVGEEILAYGLADGEGAAAPADSKEGFDTAVDLPDDDPDWRAGNPMLGPNVWPRETPGLREAVTAYHGAALSLGRQLMRAMALALGLDELYFDPFITKPVSQLRLLHYPGGAAGDGGGLGIGAHTDYECLTILHTTGPGLQVMNAAGRWIDAPPIPGAFVINVGDMLEAWTNGRFVATPHRVLRSAHERFAFPLFFAVDYATIVSPLACCVPRGTEPLYPAVAAGDHLFAQTARTFRYLREKIERGEISIIDHVAFGRRPSAT